MPILLDVGLLRLVIPRRLEVTIAGRGYTNGGRSDGVTPVDGLTAMKGDALFVKTDVSEAAEVESLVATVIATYGRLDYPANIVGLGACASTADCTEKLWGLSRFCRNCPP